ncbi:MAG TPA: flavodoxin-dependent (E)-4-hydroxy-3-methylbut-2-enyl-diphosphate synthase [Candidatus Hydrogenedentes bacterium]|jgi:(E)-4-hydroxy-3-methylbut-2-enyl-diphosphate synthase|nr:flavodoxin-dependent (E)-4-hydroxy-3-methylbut-2-enyl-diphosphate synthase [Candidatus Hydrogenedentota bacterium]HPJ99221.1 flavodoxin-dependent (E)-4-hydroxy-3-methylbut-2-enyl-diphosphate synthase [Candidatus Hydrogenedentota bacterium]
MAVAKRRETVGVMVGNVQVGGGAPVVVQSMTNTDTADVDSTATQIMELADAGSELVRMTVNVPKAAEAAGEIVQRIRDAGYTTPIVGDFHYNGHKLLAQHPQCAQALDKYRINPGNTGKGSSRDANFETICKIAADHGKPVRIGVNIGSLNPELVLRKMQENSDKSLGRSSDEVMNACMIISALESTELALEAGLRRDQIIISCKTSTPVHLIDLYRELSSKTEQPLHLGLTEAGMGSKGLLWSAAAVAPLLCEGIGDTLRVSLTPRPGSDRREEVYACCDILQALELRAFAPSITSCPGCGRTTSTTFQELAQLTEAHIKERMPEWRKRYKGVETLKLAVMGCVVNGPGESKAANVGISLPGSGESPVCPVYVDGEKVASLKGTPEELASEFRDIIDRYVETRFGPGTT